MPRSVQEILDQSAELAARFEDYEPRAEDERDPEAFKALHQATLARAEAEKQIREAVLGAREHGYSWATIGSLLGTSGEAAHQITAASGNRTANFDQDVGEHGDLL